METLLYEHLRENALANGFHGPVTVWPLNPWLKEGSMIELTMAIEGTGYRWFKDGQLIEEVLPRIVGTNTSQLIISSLVVDDPGEYEGICDCVDTELLDITDPFYLQVLLIGSLPVASFVKLMAIIFVLVVLVGLRSWKRRTT